MLLSVPHYKQLKLLILLSVVGINSAFTCKALRILDDLKHLKPSGHFMIRYDIVMNVKLDSN
jgi:hypothetical protein